MSLNFHFPREVDEATWQTLPLAMMIIGIGKITGKNAKEVAFRIHFYEKLNGAMRQGWTDDRKPKAFPYTLEEISANIGFRCNVKDESRASFIKRIVTNLERDFTYANRKG